MGGPFYAFLAVIVTLFLLLPICFWLAFVGVWPVWTLLLDGVLFALAAGLMIMELVKQGEGL